MSIESVMPSNHLILCRPLLLSSVFPTGSFPVGQLFKSGGQRMGASASVLPMNIQDWSPLGWTGWISLQSKGISRVFSSTKVQKHQFFSTQHSPTLTSRHDHWEECTNDKLWHTYILWNYCHNQNNEDVCHSQSLSRCFPYLPTLDCHMQQPICFLSI